MNLSAATPPTKDEIRAYVRQHMDRNPRSEMADLATGWRVKFSRPMDADETDVVQAVFTDLASERAVRDAENEAEADLHRPKGLARLLFLGARGQTLMGVALILGLLYGILGVDRASNVVMYGFVYSVGVVIIPAGLLSWGVGALVSRLGRRVFIRPA